LIDDDAGAQALSVTFSGAAAYSGGTTGTVPFALLDNTI